ncbi:endolytic transglycosylase MltG [Legionella spiritensis]|uniref:Endolytic murein transglycosylase n=1 Tax=Legionella spiritensis TaxID=452 RepID=A0A0W0Z4F9_LEGSP|nr:endolytic transglycosylase MltG [Legionella spiritensis]KTD64026.1 periplasmic solute-binding protein [Legionella spiritensis]SNV37267.1 putative periplasmic solute-binding protein [Legionella spiritensis]
MKQRVIIRFFSIVILAGLIGVALFTYNINSLLTRPMLQDGKPPVLLTVKPNATANSVVNNLYDLKLIRNKKLFLALVRVQGVTNRLKAGIYQVLPGETPQQLLTKIVQGNVLVESFQIIEGSTLQQVMNNLQHAPFLNFNTDDLQTLSAPFTSPEGLLLADTYNYDAGDDASLLLKTANKNLLEYLKSAWDSRSPGLPYTSPYQMLIAASILEKETAIAEERRLIAGVIVNRLTRNMPLQMDPTVIYGLGARYKGKLTHDDLGVDSPYNTYRRRGLPPTPIAMVGKDAIDAAAHPIKNNYIYFVAKGDGSHQFSETYSQQKKAILYYKYKIKEPS